MRKVSREMTLLLSEKSNKEPTLPTGNECLFYYLKKINIFFSDYKVSVMVGTDIVPCYHQKPEKFPFLLGTSAQVKTDSCLLWTSQGEPV